MGVDRPVIGVSCYVEDVDRAPWVAQRSAVLPHGYVDHLERAGALVVVLPPRPDADDDLAAAVLARLDGLVIAGGADVEAARYGAPPHITSQDPRPDRDAWELALARVSKVARMPVLGICRGMQVMAVAGGAALEQHLPDVVGNDEHCPAPGVYAHHLVTPVSGTRLAGILGDGPLDVPTYHHPALLQPRRVGPPPGRAALLTRGHRLPGRRLARRRHARGDGGPGIAVPGGRAVAPRGGRGPATVRRARRVCETGRRPRVTITR